MDINFKKSKYEIILGSASPRRRMYFDLLKIPYKVMIPNVDEIYPTELKESEISNYLAKIKSKNLKSKLKKNEILVTADTIVWFNNKHIGKPKKFLLVELGPGDGTLCNDLLKTFVKFENFYSSLEINLLIFITFLLTQKITTEIMTSNASISKKPIKKL